MEKNNDFNIVKGHVRLEEYICSILSIEMKTCSQAKWLDLEECPFCKSKDCFKIQVQDQVFHCFSCYSHGDVFHFAEAFFLISRYEALIKVAKYAQIEIKNDATHRAKSKAIYDRQKIYDIAIEFFHQNLIRSKENYQFLIKH